MTPTVHGDQVPAAGVPATDRPTQVALAMIWPARGEMTVTPRDPPEPSPFLRRQMIVRVGMPVVRVGDPSSDRRDCTLL
jgi:hypothetical protein